MLCYILLHYISGEFIILGACIRHTVNETTIHLKALCTLTFTHLCTPRGNTSQSVHTVDVALKVLTKAHIHLKPIHQFSIYLISLWFLNHMDKCCLVLPPTFTTYYISHKDRQTVLKDNVLFCFFQKTLSIFIS